MRLYEIIQETTTSGSIAPVVQPLGIMQTRSGNTKYNTRKKKKPEYARRRS